jgi:hypothetical protein
MKSFKIYLTLLSVSFLLASCFDDKEILFEDTQVEFEDAVMRARATGQIFPIINITTRTPTVAATTFQINLVGRQLTQAADIGFSLDTVPKALLNATTIEAQAGVHFNLTAAAISFPEQASTVKLQPFTIDAAFPAQAGKTAIFVIKLDGNDKIKPSENFRRIGFRLTLN